MKNKRAKNKRAKKTLLVGQGRSLVSRSKRDLRYSLVNDEFLSFSRRLLHERKNLVYYAINSNDLVFKVDGAKVQSLGHSDAWTQYIVSTIAAVDNFIDLDFVYTDDFDAADIKIYQVPWVDGKVDSQVVGRVEAGESDWILQYQAKNNYSRAKWRGYFDANTFVHELGHTLGLSHPRTANYPAGLGADSRFTTQDTAMSYNLPKGVGDFYPYFFTKNDLLTLGSIWGFEGGSKGGMREIIEQSYFGGPGRDQLTGTKGSDILWGMEGDDELLSQGSGIDILVGGLGDDTFYVDGYTEILDASPGETVVLGNLDDDQIKQLQISDGSNGASLSLGQETFLLIHGQQLVFSGMEGAFLVYQVV